MNSINSREVFYAAPEEFHFLWSLYGDEILSVKELYRELYKKEDGDNDPFIKELFFRLIRDRYGRTEQEIKKSLVALRRLD